MLLSKNRAKLILDKISKTSPIRPKLTDYKIEGTFVILSVEFKPQGFNTEWQELHALSGTLRADDFTDPKPGFAIFRIHALSWR